MQWQTTPLIVFSERLTDGIIVTFNDGKSAVYSSALLYATLPQAKELHESQADE